MHRNGLCQIMRSESDIVERFVTLTSIIIQQPEVILCQ